MTEQEKYNKKTLEKFIKLVDFERHNIPIGLAFRLIDQIIKDTKEAIKKEIEISILQERPLNISEVVLIENILKIIFEAIDKTEVK
jgi:hypothetical protein